VKCMKIGDLVRSIPAGILVRPNRVGIIVGHTERRGQIETVMILWPDGVSYDVPADLEIVNESR